MLQLRRPVLHNLFRRLRRMGIILLSMAVLCPVAWGERAPVGREETMKHKEGARRVVSVFAAFLLAMMGLTAAATAGSLRAAAKSSM